MPPLKPAMLHHVDPARRPRESRSVAFPSPVIDQAIFFLRSHAVTLTAADGVNASSPMAVGRALEAQLTVPEHSLRVTAHHPEHYLVIFTQPAHQVNAVRRASIWVDGAAFNVASWHEHDHASFGSLLLHVRVVIEDVPMHFWSVEGAEEILGRWVRVDRLDSRTLECGHTKTFACWVWTDDVGNIPTRHSLGVLSRGAGRVEEMALSPSNAAEQSIGRASTLPIGGAWSCSGIHSRANKKMNAPDRYERFVVPEGTKKVSFEKDTKIMNAASFTIEREDHTIGNILRMQLHRDPNVHFAGYKLPHPLQYKIIVRIHTASQSSPTQAYTQAINDLDKELENLKQAFEDEKTRFESMKQGY
ncbi:hypothetical protein ZWY2020_058589 [Hordeum vulgare]|nr:hypothetical protein ZWY2020_058589 [Hordeum vulgare]